MKKTLKIAALAAVAALVFAACGDGYDKTESGLKYKFLSQNTDGQQVQDGDLIIGKAIIFFNDSILDSVKGEAVPLFLADKANNANYFSRNLNEGLLLLHLGDKVEFVFEADSLLPIFGQLPPAYKAGENQTMKYQIEVCEIMNEAKEMEKINKYLADNSLAVEPTPEGYYVLSVEHGNGPKVENGKSIKVNYTGRFLDGNVFDTSDKNVNPEAHDPIEYVVGEQSMIPGWEMIMATMEQGGKAKVLIPSKLAYGKSGMMAPYSSLLFDFEVLSVTTPKTEKK